MSHQSLIKNRVHLSLRHILNPMQEHTFYSLLVFFCILCLWVILSLKLCYDSRAMNCKPLNIFSVSIWFESAAPSPPSQHQTHFTPNNSSAIRGVRFHSHDNRLLWSYSIQSHNNTPASCQPMCFWSQCSWEAKQRNVFSWHNNQPNNKEVCVHRLLRALNVYLVSVLL